MACSPANVSWESSSIESAAQGRPPRRHAPRCPQSRPSWTTRSSATTRRAWPSRRSSGDATISSSSCCSSRRQPKSPRSAACRSTPSSPRSRRRKRPSTRRRRRSHASSPMGSCACTMRPRSAMERATGRTKRRSTLRAVALAVQQFADQLTEAHADVDALPAELKAFGNKSALPAEIERVQAAIAALGAVNLAALDELEIATQRKDYLDAQAADLTEAMATLENAIRQIDRESRQLLQQTFDAVNENFARLFPGLFGGGQAQLVLTGEEILDSGVQVVAQPPGKRNTSIHLLSGGEKALTAISLVFALFQLNPAPFCLLDEVDAPLDDPNTERFCAMVRRMADVTQFLFISHNKITMEMANQLVGITMPEPGTSRVVAVDIAEALSLAENAA